jgi:hypothetical protein
MEAIAAGCALYCLLASGLAVTAAQAQRRKAAATGR